MIKAMRILALMGLVLASAVEANLSSRRLPSQRVRGLKKDAGLLPKENGPAAKVSAKVAETKVDDKKKRLVPVPHMPETVSRPMPGKFDKVALNLKPEKEVSAPKLPETGQAVNLKVKKKGEKPQKLGIGKPLIGKNIGKQPENGLEHFTEVDVEVYQRDIPSFSVKFAVENSASLPNLADYNELSQVSEEYLNNFFVSVFEDVKVIHDGTALFLMASESDPFTVDFKLTLAFVIPGEVPTNNFLIDRLQDALEKETSMAFYISDLSQMSDTNPFSKTVSFEVVSRPPVSAAEMDRTGGKPQVGGIEVVGSNYVLVSLLAGAGLIVLIGTGLMWKKQKSKRGAVSDSNPAFSLFDKSNKKGTSSSGIYGADNDTMNYLNSIRKRYRDNDSSDSVSNDENLSMSSTVGTEEC